MEFSGNEMGVPKYTISDEFQTFNPVGTRIRNTTYFF
jgi:hypothetical protein